MKRLDKQDGLRTYLNGMDRYSLLNSEEEQELVRLVQRGDLDAIEKMITSNLSLVVQFAKEYQNRGLDFDDIVEQGNLGLMHAVKKFDPERGFRFSTYAGRVITSFIQKGLNDMGRTIRLPVHVHAEIGQIMNSRLELRQTLGREPSELEIAEKSMKTVKKVKTLLKSIDISNPISLDMCLYGDDYDTLTIEDRLVSSVELPDEYSTRSESQDMLYDAMMQLSADEQKIVNCSLGINGVEKMSYREIGNIMGCSHVAVSNKYNKALGKLKKLLAKRGLNNDTLYDF